MYFGFFSGNAFVDILFFVGIIFSIYAQFKVQSTYKKYSGIDNSRGISGMEIASELKNKFGMDYLKLKNISGNLTDHFNPKDKSLGLSDGVANNRSIASLAIVAHEMGHARQDAENMLIIRIRSIVYPLSSIASNAAIPLFIFGLIFSYTPLMNIGIILFVIVALFYLLTLPLEINASSRGLKMLREGNYLNEGEIKGARSVLTAAALTYVAALASAIITLLRLFALRSRR